jgi:hypothetical protein
MPPKPLPSPGIALRIEHPTVLPDWITRQLGLEPTASKDRPGRNYWLHGFRSESDESVEADVTRFLASLRTHRAILLQLRRSGGRAAIYVTWSVGRPAGFEFEFRTVLALARLRLDLYLEVFGTWIASRSAGENDPISRPKL